jgi:hypothetical protein
MIDLLRQHWPAIAAAIAALTGAGLVLKLMWTRSGRDTNIVNQKGATSNGDIVGRDKVTRETKRR